MLFSDMYNDVKEFHKKFDLKPIYENGLVDMNFRIGRLLEEVRELGEAGSDEHQIMDAMVDIVYIAMGTLYLCHPCHPISVFHNPVGLNLELSPPCQLDNDTKTNLIKTLEKIIIVTEEAHASNLDSVIYLVCAIAEKGNWPFTAAWKEVHRANMSKVRCLDPKESRYGSTSDIIKPAGWVGPDIDSVIFSHKEGVE